MSTESTLVTVKNGGNDITLVVFKFFAEETKEWVSLKLAHRSTLSCVRNGSPTPFTPCLHLCARNLHASHFLSFIREVGNFRAITRQNVIEAEDMGQTTSNRAFLLRLPSDVKEQAIELAREDGTSLNQFINHAVREKILRLKRGLSTLRMHAEPELQRTLRTEETPGKSGPSS